MSILFHLPFPLFVINRENYDFIITWSTVQIKKSKFERKDVSQLDTEFPGDLCDKDPIFCEFWPILTRLLSGGIEWYLIFLKVQSKQFSELFHGLQWSIGHSARWGGKHCRIFVHVIFLLFCKQSCSSKSKTFTDHYILERWCTAVLLRDRQLH